MLWRRAFVILVIVAQILVMAYYLYNRSAASQIVNAALIFMSFLVSFYIAGRDGKPAYKILWIILILSFPIFGGVFYLLSNQQAFSRSFHRVLQEKEDEQRPHRFRGGSVLGGAVGEHPEFSAQIRYLEGFAGFPVFSQTGTLYLASGEEYFERLLTELDKAERYIFVESFILQEGKMLNTILDKLEEKARQGLDVRLMYDDIGCFLTLPARYKQSVEARGIKCTVFNPFNMILSTMQNNRDHRKIVSIDGKVAFTGGVNIADEYINEYVKYGHWRDSAILLTGEAAWSLTLIFLHLWDFSNRSQQEDFDALYPWKDGPCEQEPDGYVQPYADSPIDEENVGEHVYIQIISHAKDYLYINTPYLIIDENVLSALKLAAKSGVDVRIITPQIWDKPIARSASRSYYRELIRAGIKIYEYTGGFNHAKTFVSDDIVATVGTTNLDYRSLYLHFECGVAMYRSSAVMQVKEDFLATVSRCELITEARMMNRPLTRMVQEVLRVFAPLL
jgi:cardiolipin synthase